MTVPNLRSVTRWGPVERSPLQPIDGGVTAPAGFAAAGIAAGLKPSGKRDLALVLAEQSSACAVTTTTNLVKAAPCIVTTEHAQNGRARAIVINAGNANACTGSTGMSDARAMAAGVADLTGVEASDVLVMSTGIIGVPMPMDRVLRGLRPLVADLSADGGDRAAEAITTTDTRLKTVAYEVRDEKGSCRIGAMAKGAGMMEPAMATMLCVITTDAPMSGAVLKPMLRQAVTNSFNRISIDACGSTNDTVAVLASGQAPRPPGLAAFQIGLEAVCADLAREIVRDGEGTKKVGYITVTGALTDDDAVGLARSISGSVLFRAALHGADPNWGRILAAMGASGIAFEPDRVSVSCGGITVCRFGTAASFDRGQAVAAMSKPEVEIVVDLGLGDRRATFLTADLTPEYVAENAYYTT